jgi:AAA domain
MLSDIPVGLNLETTGWDKPIPNKEETSQYKSSQRDFPSEELTEARLKALNAFATYECFQNPLDADTINIEPKYLPDNLGACIFAPGLIQWLYGPSETGKSFIALTACLQAAGVYFSLEMGPNQMGTRVKKMGFHYLDSNLFSFPQSSEVLKQQLILIKLMEPTIVVIDSFAELALLCGGDTNNDQDVGAIFRDFLKPLAAVGHSVVVVDHIAKNPANNEYPLGTQNKKSQSDICLYINKNSESGILELTVTKDRYYLYAGRLNTSDRKYGSVEITDSPTRAKVHRQGYEDFMPIANSTSGDRQMQDKVMKALKEFGALQKSHIKYKVTGSEKRIDKAITMLAEGGWLAIRKEKNPDGYSCRMVTLTGKAWSTAPVLHGM